MPPPGSTIQHFSRFHDAAYRPSLRKERKPRQINLGLHRDVRYVLSFFAGIHVWRLIRGIEEPFFPAVSLGDKGLSPEIVIVQKGKRTSHSTHIHFQSGDIAKLKIRETGKQIFALEPVGVPVRRT